MLLRSLFLRYTGRFAVGTISSIRNLPKGKVLIYRWGFILSFLHDLWTYHGKVDEEEERSGQVVFASSLIDPLLIDESTNHELLSVA